MRKMSSKIAAEYLTRSEMRMISGGSGGGGFNCSTVNCDKETKCDSQCVCDIDEGATSGVCVDKID